MAAVTEAHAALEALVGKDNWQTWGSEQITSNFLVANIAGAVVLPPSRYASHFAIDGEIDYSRVAMIHFIGSQRFTNGTFQREALRTVRALLADR